MRTSGVTRNPFATFVLLVASAPAAAALPAGLGWHELPNTRLRPHCPTSAEYPSLAPATCDGITAYSGAVFDTAGNRLLIAGGGHNDWAGNEVYELDLDTQAVRRLNNPSSVVRDGCSNGGTNADGRPVARHTYTNIEYMAGQNLLFLFGGGLSFNGCLADDAWTFDPAANQWTARPSPVKPRPDFNMAVIRDPHSGLLYARDAQHLYAFSPTTFTWTQRSDAGDANIDSYKSAVIDPVRKRYHFYVAGTRKLRSYDIASPTATLVQQTRDTPDCSFMDQDAIGWAYDPSLDRFVAWNGGDTVHLMHPDTAACTTMTISGGPARAQNGTYGRFRYSPTSGVYLSCNRVDDNCYILRLSESLPDRLFDDDFE